MCGSQSHDGQGSLQRTQEPWRSWWGRASMSITRAIPDGNPRRARFVLSMVLSHCIGRCVPAQKAAVSCSAATHDRASSATLAIAARSSAVTAPSRRSTWRSPTGLARLGEGAGHSVALSERGTREGWIRNAFEQILERAADVSASQSAARAFRALLRERAQRCRECVTLPPPRRNARGPGSSRDASMALGRSAGAALNILAKATRCERSFQRRWWRSGPRRPSSGCSDRRPGYGHRLKALTRPLNLIEERGSFLS